MCISLLIGIICHFPISVQLLLVETVAEHTWEDRHTHTHRCSCLSGLIDRANDATGRRGDCRQADEVGLTLVGCLSIVTVYSILYMYIYSLYSVLGTILLRGIMIPGSCIQTRAVVLLPVQTS